MFLSPPWGGIKYKDSGIYNIRELMTPNIIDIVKVSLKIAKNIIFYLPRTLVLEDLIDILVNCITENNNKNELYNTNLLTNNQLEKIYLDVHILKSANKIKALMIIFGTEVDNEINSDNLKDYLELNYPEAPADKIQTLCNIVKIIGAFKFFKAETQLKKTYCQATNVIKTFYDALIKYITTQIMTDLQIAKYKKSENKNNNCTNFLHSLGTNINTGTTNIVFKEKQVKNTETSNTPSNKAVLQNENLKNNSGLNLNSNNKLSKGIINLNNNALYLKKKK